MQSKVRRNLPLICLVLTALAYLAFQFCQVRYRLVMEHYICPVLFLFLGITLFSDGLRKRADVWIGMLMMGWYAVTRVLMGELYLENCYADFTGIFAAVCLALPFSMACDERKKGLRIVSVLFVLVIGFTAWLSVFGIILGRQIKLPVIGSVFGKDLFEARLFANLNTNLSAAMFLVALVLGVWYLLEYGSKWIKIPAVVLFIGLYAGLALCVSRTVMIQFGIAVAALVFFLCLRLPIRNRWLHTGVSALIAAVVLIGIYMSFDVVRSLVNQAVIPAAMAESIAKRPLIKDLLTLTDRTRIYYNLWNALIDNPKIFFIGTTAQELTDLLRKYTGVFAHAHNAYLQTLLIMGIPGLLAALWFSFRAVWVGWKLLLVYRNRTTLAQKWLAISVLSMLLSTIPEPYLFAAFLPPYHFVFFLLLGYLLQLERSLRAE